ncbi:hypothetical protein C0993_004128 [Termitomyces sp. T159_Od127]|nr:hypothetical protein C0993_004128 [Termitomyces sp. T159_Od127]
MAKLSTLHQTINHISQSLQALLEHLPSITAPPLVAETSLAAPAEVCVESFTDWAALEKDFQAEFFPINPAKSAALVLHNKEQYEQRKRTFNKHIGSF